MQFGKQILSQQCFGYAFEEVRYDCGNKLGYLIATVEIGLRNKEVGEKFKYYLSNLA